MQTGFKSAVSDYTCVLQLTGIRSKQMFRTIQCFIK